MSSAAAMATCISWVETALPSLAAVIRARPEIADAPRPALPYAVLEWTAHHRLSATPYEITTDKIIDPGAQYDTAQRRYTRTEGHLRVTIYGDGGADLLHDLLHSTHRVTEKALLRDAGIGIRALGDILDTAELRSTEWEPSAAVDLAVLYVSSDESAVATIESEDIPITTS